MTGLPPLFRDQRKADADHLRLLAVFHFVFAGLAVLGLGLLALHYALMHSLFLHPEKWSQQKNAAPPPKELFAVLKWFYIIIGSALVAALIANLLSGVLICKRRGRVFSLVVGGINCIQIPFGTVLGVFTIVVLLRDSVRELYEPCNPGVAAPSPSPSTGQGNDSP
jgi:hypothetical protein